MGEWVIEVDKDEVPLHNDELESWIKGLIVGRNVSIEPPHKITGIGRYGEKINLKCNGINVEIRIRKGD